MDAKILAAVFASLAAVFAGVNGGMFSASDVRQVSAETPGVSTPSANSFLPDIPMLDRLLEKPEPTNDISARITVHGPASVKLKNAHLEAQNLSTIKSRSMEIDSDEEILFSNFNGRIEFGNTSKITGTASGMQSSGVNITTRINLDTKVDTGRIEAIGTQRTPINFATASIEPVEGSDFPINTEEDNLNINSFTGDITVLPGNSTLLIDGKIARLKAGKATYGGQ